MNSRSIKKPSIAGRLGTGMPMVAMAAMFAGTCMAAESYGVDDFASIEKIDVHVHINSLDTALIDEAAQSHFRLITINVDYPDFPPLADQRAVALSQVKSHP